MNKKTGLMLAVVFAAFLFLAACADMEDPAAPAPGDDAGDDPLGEPQPADGAPEDDFPDDMGEPQPIEP